MTEMNDWMASPTRWTEFEQAPGIAEGQEAQRAAVHGLQRVGPWLEMPELNSDY